jgi:hypothetical protein
MFRQQSVPQRREGFKRSKQEFWRAAGADFWGDAGLDLAEVKATPHTFRHQAVTWLTRHSGMAGAELQL